MTHWTLRAGGLGLCLSATLALGACGSATQARTSPTATARPTTAATATPSPTPRIGAEQPECTPGTLDPQFGPVGKSGTLMVQVRPAQDLQVEGRDVWQQRLPDTQPKAPLSSVDLAKIPSAAPVNITSYDIGICNTGSQPVSMTGLAVKLNAFTPQTAPVNWTTGPCGYIYFRAQGVQLGACDRILTFTLAAKAAFATGAAPGASATLTMQQGAFPQAIAPGHMVFSLVRIAGLSAPGSYSFAFQVSTSGASPLTVASAPHLAYLPDKPWDGKGCTAPAMQSQIPSGSADLFVCPPA